MLHVCMCVHDMLCKLYCFVHTNYICSTASKSLSFKLGKIGIKLCINLETIFLSYFITTFDVDNLCKN